MCKCHLCRESESEEEEIDPWKIQVGPKHQAVLPTLQQRPAVPPPAEAKYLSNPIYTPSPAAAAAAEPAQQQQQGSGLLNQIGSGNALMDAAAAAMHAVQQRAASLGQQLQNSSTSSAAAGSSAAGLAAAPARFNMHTAGGMDPNPGLAFYAGEFREWYQSCSTGEERRELLEQWVEHMDIALGPELVQVCCFSYTLLTMALAMTQSRSSSGTYTACIGFSKWFGVTVSGTQSIAKVY